MKKKFSRLQLWDDFSQRTPAAQMACDEALVKRCEYPALRVYRWAYPAVTFGYAQRLEAVRVMSFGNPLMRRWTGGGVVFHGTDLTLALFLPATEALTTGTSMDVYRSIHEGLLGAIQKNMPDARLVSPEECRAGPVCFESPAPFDIIVGKTKICGGALRRSREGVLYQGSLHSPSAMPFEIAQAFANQVSEFEKPDAMELVVSTLVDGKYGASEWLTLR